MSRQGVIVVKGEIHNVLSILRLHRRTREEDARFRVEIPIQLEDSLIRGFLTLHSQLEGYNDLFEVDSVLFLTPFLDVITSPQTSEDLKSLSLASINKFLLYGFVAPDSLRATEAINMVVECVTNTPITSRLQEQAVEEEDEILLMKLIEVLNECIRCEAGTLLTDGNVWATVRSVYFISRCGIGGRLLRSIAENALAHIILELFQREVVAADNLADRPPEATPPPILERSRSRHSATPPVTDSPESLPALPRVVLWLSSLLDPAGSPDVDTRQLALSLINIILETTGSSLSLIPEMKSVVQRSLCRSLLLNCTSKTSELAVLSLTLRVIYNLFDSMKEHLKVQLEVFFTSVHLRLICGVTVENAVRELALESVVEFCQEPMLMRDLFANYDCDVAASSLFERLIYTLCGTAIPGAVGLRLLQGPAGDKPGSTFSPPSDMETSSETGYLLCLNRLNRVALEGVLAVISGLVRRCYGPVWREGESAVEGEVAGSSSSGMNKDAHPSLGAEDLRKRRQLKRKLIMVADTFNEQKGKGKGWINYAQQLEILPRPCTAAAVAKFLRETPRLNPQLVGEFLCRPETAEHKFEVEVRDEYISTFDFSDMSFVDALRLFLRGFRLPGEAQVIDRIMEAFAQRLFQMNPGPLPSSDTAFVLAFSVIMLNTDLHNDQVKKKMTRKEFVSNNRGIADGKDLPPEYLEEVYNCIQAQQIQLAPDLQALGPCLLPSQWEGVLLLQESMAGASFTLAGADGFVGLSIAGSTERDMAMLVLDPFVTALTTAFELTSDGSLLLPLLDGMAGVLRICSFFGLEQWHNTACVTICVLCQRLLEDALSNQGVMMLALAESTENSSGLRSLFDTFEGEGEDALSSDGEEDFPEDPSPEVDGARVRQLLDPLFKATLALCESTLTAGEVSAAGKTSLPGVPPNFRAQQQHMTPWFPPFLTAVAKPCVLTMLLAHVASTAPYSSLLRESWRNVLRLVCRLRQTGLLPLELIELDDFRAANGHLLPSVMGRDPHEQCRHPLKTTEASGDAVSSDSIVASVECPHLLVLLESGSGNGLVSSCQFDAQFSFLQLSRKLKAARLGSEDGIFKSLTNMLWVEEEEEEDSRVYELLNQAVATSRMTKILSASHTLSIESAEALVHALMTMMAEEVLSEVNAVFKKCMTPLQSARDGYGSGQSELDVVFCLEFLSAVVWRSLCCQKAPRLWQLYTSFLSRLLKGEHERQMSVFVIERAVVCLLKILVDHAGSLFRRDAFLSSLALLLLPASELFTTTVLQRVAVGVHLLVCSHGRSLPPDSAHWNTVFAVLGRTLGDPHSRRLTWDALLGMVRMYSDMCTPPTVFMPRPRGSTSIFHLISQPPALAVLLLQALFAFASRTGRPAVDSEEKKKRKKHHHHDAHDQTATSEIQCKAVRCIQRLCTVSASGFGMFSLESESAVEEPLRCDVCGNDAEKMPSPIVVRPLLLMTSGDALAVSGESQDISSPLKPQKAESCRPAPAWVWSCWIHCIRALCRLLRHHSDTVVLNCVWDSLRGCLITDVALELTGADWLYILDGIVLPLLDVQSGREEFVLNAVQLVSKTFLQHLRELVMAPDFHLLWMKLLSLLVRLMNTSHDGRSIVCETVSEGLKNLLLVSKAEGAFRVVMANTGQDLWRMTNTVLTSLTPGMQSEVMAIYDMLGPPTSPDGTPPPPEEEEVMEEEEENRSEDS